MRFARLGTVAAAALLAVTAGCDTARTLEHESELGSCDRCHGFPPAAPHPTVVAEATACSACHPATVDASGTIIAGGAHQNGDVDAAGGHAEGYGSPAVHGPEAIAFLSGTAGALTCTSCHGTDFAGRDPAPSCNACHASASGSATSWRENCTFCHGNQTPDYAAVANPVEAAPPEGVSGETEPTDHAVGAHQKHLRVGTYSNGFTCATCHAVPSDLGHLDGEAAVTPSGAGQRFLPASLGTYAPETHSCSVYCHGSTITTPAPTAPVWMAAGALACNACHATRPSTGRHTSIGAHRDAPCADCHLGYAEGATVDRAIHVDGQKTVVFPVRGGSGATRTLANPGWTDCSVCHGADGNANAPQF